MFKNSGQNNMTQGVVRQKISSVIVSTAYLLSCLVVSTAKAESRAVADGGRDTGAPVVEHLRVERLPDLNIARAGHQTFVCGNEIVVMGGHKDGFVMTPTAEYYSEGRWYVVPMVYVHDFGTGLQLRSGDILMAGGSLQDLGIGQTHTVERWNPSSHKFTGFGCLDTKRMYASAVELPNGEVVISGNWFHADNTELFDGKKTFAMANSTSFRRAVPYILPISSNDAVIFGSYDNGYIRRDSAYIVDRVHAPSFDVPLFREWQPFTPLIPSSYSDCMIGNVSTNDYRYLILVINNKFDFRIAEVCDTTVRIVADSAPLPRVTSSGDSINYFASLLVDRRVQRGYAVGYSRNHKFYVYSFRYTNGDPVRISDARLCYTDVLPDLGESRPVITPEGDIVLVGGVIDDHFYPQGGAYRLLIGTGGDAMGQGGGAVWMWWLAGVILAVLTVLAVAVILRRRGACGAVACCGKTGADAGETSAETEELKQRVIDLMEQQKLYLNSELKVGDVAEALGIGRRQASESVMSFGVTSFSQFVNGYRVEHAKQMLLGNRDIKIGGVWAESGFSNETSFFRVFKQFTGMTPREWLQTVD